MASSTNSEDASRLPAPGSTARQPRSTNSLEDLDLDQDDDIEDHKKLMTDTLWPALRSAPLINLIEYGLPEAQRWLFYLLLVQFHEDFC
jgi:hypothetical protein